MERRIISLPVHRTSMIMAVTSAVFGLALALVMMPLMMASMGMMRAAMPSGSPTEMPMFPFGLGMGMMAVIMPIMYFIFGYIGTAIFVFVFNMVAGRMGGLPVEIADQAI